MKTYSSFKNAPLMAVLILSLGLPGVGLAADKTPAATTTTTSQTVAEAPVAVASAPDTEQYNNWVDLGMGTQFVSGDQAAFQHFTGNSGSLFGGIDDMHLEQAPWKGGLLSLDGHAIFGNNDYKIKAELSQTDLGYIRGGYTEFRTWEDGNAGYFPINGKDIAPYKDKFALDRGTIWAELGLRMPNVPEITIHYAHDFREGQKDSLSWGQTFQTGLKNAGNNNQLNARAIVPSFRDINESRDTITLDGSKTYGNTDVSLGGIYEYVNNSDSLNISRYPAVQPATTTFSTPSFITQKDKEKSDLFSGHGAIVTRFSDELWLSSAYSYTSIDTNIAGGTRIYGTTDDPGIAYLKATATQAGMILGSGYLNLYGGSTVDQHVANLNLMWQPVDSLTITPSIRVEMQDTDSDSNYTQLAAGSTSATLMPRSTHNITSEVLLNVSECLDVRYNGIEDWVFYGTANWEEEDSTRKETSDNSYLSGNRPLNLDEDQSVLRQKYALGANWYPLPHLNLAAQYYHKIERDNNNFNSDEVIATANQRLAAQTFNTDDLNFRVTWHPCSKVALVSRYDYTYTQVDSKWGVNPGVAGGFTLNTHESSEVTNNILSESITWTPFSRLYLLAGGSYVLNLTKTPAYDQISTPVVVNFRSNYWMGNFSAGFALDDKTDIKADYTYYSANDYDNNSMYGMPYGSGATQHTASAVLNRQLSKNVKLSLRYAYVNYSDTTYGGFNDYEGHVVYTSVQSRF